MLKYSATRCIDPVRHVQHILTFNILKIGELSHSCMSRRTTTLEVIS